MIFTPLAIDGVYKIDLEKRGDSRGFFARFFCTQEFAEHGLEIRWEQINTSLSATKGTIRGLHFQRPPKAEVKVVRCLRGAILDVVVDMRAGSPSFGRWVSLELSEANKSMIYVPRGFAHGLQTLTPDAEILYLNSASYSPALEGGLRYNDPALGIPWPLPVAEISPRDASHPDLAAQEPITL